MRETHEHTNITLVSGLVITYRAIGSLLSLLVPTGPCGTIIYVASPHCIAHKLVEHVHFTYALDTVLPLCGMKYYTITLFYSIYGPLLP